MILNIKSAIIYEYISFHKGGIIWYNRYRFAGGDFLYRSDLIRDANSFWANVK